MMNVLFVRLPHTFMPCTACNYGEIWIFCLFGYLAPAYWEIWCANYFYIFSSDWKKDWATYIFYKIANFVLFPKNSNCPQISAFLHIIIAKRAEYQKKIIQKFPKFRLLPPCGLSLDLILWPHGIFPPTGTHIVISPPFTCVVNILTSSHLRKTWILQTIQLCMC